MLPQRFPASSLRLSRSVGDVTQRCTNYFSDGLELRAAYEAPPCVHLTMTIKGWIYEVMLLLEDFAATKSRLHKFYQIERATDPSEIMFPVFDLETAPPP